MPLRSRPGRHADHVARRANATDRGPMANTARESAAMPKNRQVPAVSDRDLPSAQPSRDLPNRLKPSSPLASIAKAAGSGTGTCAGVA